MRHRTTTAAAALTAALLVGVAGCSTTPTSGTSATPSGGSTSTLSPVSPTPSGTSSASASSQAAALRYLMEEEKLAHDVYEHFAAVWGDRVFGNIAASEVTHQALLVPALAAAGVPDPRTGRAGTFTDLRIQATYDRLVRQGSTSLRGAYEAGVTIEKQDIVDLERDLRSISDPTVAAVLQRLLAGSRMHLQAFQSHLG